MTERERIALRERWSGRTLEDPSDAYALHNDAWAAAMEEAKGLCSDHETCRALARLALSEVVADHKKHPVSKDVYSEIVVKICLLYGKLGSNLARIRRKAEWLPEMDVNEEAAPAKREKPPRPDPEPELVEKETAGETEVQEPHLREPAPVRCEPVEPDVRPTEKTEVFVEKKEETAGEAEVQEPHLREPAPVRREAMEPDVRPTEKTEVFVEKKEETAGGAEVQEPQLQEPAPVRREAVEPDVRPTEKAEVFVEKKEQLPPEPPHVEEPYFRESRTSAIPRDFPRMWESPQIQINVISSDWDRGRPLVQYAAPMYPQGMNAVPQPIPAFAPPVQPAPEPQRAPDPPPAVEPIPAVQPQPMPAVQPAAQPQTVPKVEEAKKPPKETAKKRPATRHKEQGSSKAEGNNQGYLGLMIVAIVAAFGSLIALLWQAGVFG